MVVIKMELNIKAPSIFLDKGLEIKRKKIGACLLKVLLILAMGLFYYPCKQAIKRPNGQIGKHGSSFLICTLQ